MTLILYPMTYAVARSLVIADQLEAEDREDGATDADIIAHVRNTITLPHVHAVGGWPIDDNQDALSAAYVLIVATEDEGATITPFAPDVRLRQLMADGHPIRTGHTLTGYYVTTGGLSTLIRTCECADEGTAGDTPAAPEFTEDRLTTLAAALPEFAMQHLGGGLYGLILERPEGVWVVTDEGDPIYLGFYAGAAWDEAQEPTDMHRLSGEQDTPAAALTIRRIVGLEAHA